MKTKPVVIVGLLLIMAAFVAPVAAGNGAPSGAHFTLNIVGTKDKINMPDNLGGHTLFVKLDRSGAKVTTDIILHEGNFAVLDKNGADGEVMFQLPYPYTEIDGDGIIDGDEVGCYEIWARALSPFGKANMTTCTEDVDADYGFGTYCDTANTITLGRTGKGVGKFMDVTSALTTLEDVPGVPGSGDIPIFADTEDAYWWQYDNYGLKHAQLRFYEIPGTECASH
jgi:hypothetical protein